jgi:hypothetical protein
MMFVLLMTMMYITAFNWTAVRVYSSLSALPLLLSKPREWRVYST